MKTETDFLIIGKVIKPFGIKGEVKLFPITDSMQRFNDLKSVYLKKGITFQKVAVKSARASNKFVLLKLNGYDSRNDVESLQGKYIYVARENAAKIGDGSYYYYDLLGCTIKTLQGDVLGTVYDIQNAGSCDIYFIRSCNSKQEDFMIPAVSDIVKEVNIRAKEIVIEVIDGLLS